MGKLVSGTFSCDPKNHMLRHWLEAQPKEQALQVCATSVRECELLKLLGQSKVLGICIYMSVACDSLHVLMHCLFQPHVFATVTQSLMSGSCKSNFVRT